MGDHCFPPNWTLLHCLTQAKEGITPTPQTPSLNATCDPDVPMCFPPPGLPLSVSIQMRLLKSAHSFQVAQAPLSQCLRAFLGEGGTKFLHFSHASPHCYPFLHFCLSPAASVLSGALTPTPSLLFSPGQIQPKCYCSKPTSMLSYITSPKGSPLLFTMHWLPSPSFFLFASAGNGCHISPYLLQPLPGVHLPLPPFPVSLSAQG